MVCIIKNINVIILHQVVGFIFAPYYTYNVIYLFTKGGYILILWAIITLWFCCWCPFSVSVKTVSQSSSKYERSSLSLKQKWCLIQTGTPPPALLTLWCLRLYSNTIHTNPHLCRSNKFQRKKTTTVKSYFNKKRNFILYNENKSHLLKGFFIGPQQWFRLKSIFSSRIRESGVGYEHGCTLWSGIRGWSWIDRTLLTAPRKLDGESIIL